MDGENNGLNPIKMGWFGDTMIFGNIRFNPVEQY